MMLTTKRVVALVGCAIALSVLVGCTAEPAPSTSASVAPGATPGASEPAASPSATPLPTAQVAVAVPGSCEELVPVAVIDDVLGETWKDSAEPVEAEESLPGPTAREAAAGATEALACRWVPDPAYGGYLLGFAMRLDADARTALVAALGASSAYEPVLIEGADVAFSTSELRGDLHHTTTYAFLGDVWLAFESPLFADRIAAFAATAVESITG